MKLNVGYRNPRWRKKIIHFDASIEINRATAKSFPGQWNEFAMVYELWHDGRARQKVDQFLGVTNSGELALVPVRPPLCHVSRRGRRLRLVRRSRYTYDTCSWRPEAGTVAQQSGDGRGKTNLSHDGLNPAHIPYWWMKNLTFGEFYFTMIRRADIEGSKSNVAMNLGCHKPVISVVTFLTPLALNFEAHHGHLREGSKSNVAMNLGCHKPVISVLIIGHLRYLLTDVLPQPNSPPDNVFHPDWPVEANLGSKKGAIP
ncbi:hypothetical protein GOBAR_DD14314 [Gossypium barbadense]|nr:hypothetical protein GOBAR_DD14314 [Gossypium barbadense]